MALLLTTFVGITGEAITVAVIAIQPYSHASTEVVYQPSVLSPTAKEELNDL